MYTRCPTCDAVIAVERDGQAWRPVCPRCTTPRTLRSALASAWRWANEDDPKLHSNPPDGAWKLVLLGGPAVIAAVGVALALERLLPPTTYALLAAIVTPVMTALYLVGFALFVAAGFAGQLEPRPRPHRPR
jgi:hypothetical protein